MILAVEVVSICATLVPMIRAKRRRLARLTEWAGRPIGRRLAERYRDSRLREPSLRHMEPEHLISPPCERHVPQPQEERTPRSGST
jgi:hypothetical protein